MSIRKHPASGIWHIDFRTPNGTRVRQSAGTTERKAAQELHDRLKAQLWRQERLGEKPEGTFEAAAVAVLKASQGQKDYRTKVRHISYWRTVFQGQPLSSLTAKAILEGLPTHYVRQGTQQRKAISKTTQNRYLATMRTMLNLAQEQGMLHAAPKIRLFREKTLVIRFLTKQQARDFLHALDLPWMRQVCQFALATGMRAGEIFGLTWDKVDLPRQLAWVSADKAKSSRARAVPLNTEAIAVLQQRQRLGQSRVFTRDGADIDIKQIDRRCFNRALEAAGVKLPFRFHDLRHTWASWHVQSGTHLFALKELGGWETLEMVKRYAHLAPEHLNQYASAVKIWSNSTPGNKKAA